MESVTNLLHWWTSTTVLVYLWDKLTWECTTIRWLLINMFWISKCSYKRDSLFHAEYTNFMNDIISMDYAERMPAEDIGCCDGRVWYIPHHGVHHPQKRKLRVVSDCGATFQGTSFNTQGSKSDQLVRWCYYQVPKGACGAYSRHHSHVPPGQSTKSWCGPVKVYLVAGWGPWSRSGGIQNGCASVRRHILSKLRKFCVKEMCRK